MVNKVVNVMFFLHTSFLHFCSTDFFFQVIFSLFTVNLIQKWRQCIDFFSMRGFSKPWLNIGLIFQWWCITLVKISYKQCCVLIVHSVQTFLRNELLSSQYILRITRWMIIQVHWLHEYFYSVFVPLVL